MRLIAGTRPLRKVFLLLFVHKKKAFFLAKTQQKTFAPS